MYLNCRYKVLDVHLSDLVQDVEGTVKRMLDFIGVVRDRRSHGIACRLTLYSWSCNINVFISCHVCPCGDTFSLVPRPISTQWPTSSAISATTNTKETRSQARTSAIRPKDHFSPQTTSCTGTTRCVSIQERVICELCEVRGCATDHGQHMFDLLQSVHYCAPYLTEIRTGT